MPRKAAPVSTISYLNELTAVHDACTCANSNRSRKRLPKTPAERSRTYRARRKLLKEMERKRNAETNLKTVKTSTNRSREYRMRKRLANKARAQVTSHISVSGKNTDMNEHSHKGLNNESVLVNNIPKTTAELDEGLQEIHAPQIDDLFSNVSVKLPGSDLGEKLEYLRDLSTDELLKVSPTEQADTKMLDGKRRKLVTEMPQASEEASMESYNAEFESYHGLSISPIHIKEETVETNRGSMMDMTISSFHQVYEGEQCSVNYSKVPSIPRQLLVEEDDDLLFFRSLLPYVRKIPDARKLTFRNRVQDLVDRFAYD